MNILSTVEILLVGIGLAMDAFSVSLANGLKRNYDIVKSLGVTNEQIQNLMKLAEETTVMSKELDDLREVVK